jgi:hypothetical protein
MCYASGTTEIILTRMNKGEIMHMLVGIVLHVTVLSIVGYLLLWTASKSEGLVALIGRLLGLWVFILAILSVVAVVLGPKGDRDHGMMHGPGMGWMHHWDGDRDGDGSPDQKVTPAPSPAVAPPAATPTTPAPVKKP